MILFKAARIESIFRKASLEVDSNLKKIPPSWLKLIKWDQVEVESDLFTRCKLQQTLHAQARGLDVKRSYNTYLPASFLCPVVQKLMLAIGLSRRPFSFLRLNAMNELTQASWAHVTRESVSDYRRLLRSGMRNKILMSANDKYFVSVKKIKETLPLMHSCLLWCEFIDLIF